MFCVDPTSLDRLRAGPTLKQHCRVFDVYPPPLSYAADYAHFALYGDALQSVSHADNNKLNGLLDIYRPINSRSHDARLYMAYMPLDIKTI